MSNNPAQQQYQDNQYNVPFPEGTNNKSNEKPEQLFATQLIYPIFELPANTEEQKKQYQGQPQDSVDNIDKPKILQNPYPILNPPLFMSAPPQPYQEMPPLQGKLLIPLPPINNFPNRPNPNNVQQPTNGIIELKYLSIQDSPTLVKCIYCNKIGKTIIYPVISGSTYLCSFLLFVTTCVCCLVPFLISHCKDKEHRCQHCRMPLGTCQYIMC